MKIILNQTKLVFNQSPEVVWEREGDYTQFKNSGSSVQAYGLCEYTRLMQENTAFDLVKFNLIKAEIAMTVNYAIIMTSYTKSSSEYNQAPELYDWSHTSQYTQILKEGTVNILTDYKDILIEVPETTVPTGKEVCVLFYGNGANKLICPTISTSAPSCNAKVFNNTANSALDAVGKWVSVSPAYAISSMPALTLMKKQ